jgi:hypothetical protein
VLTFFGFRQKNKKKIREARHPKKKLRRDSKFKKKKKKLKLFYSSFFFTKMPSTTSSVLLKLEHKSPLTHKLIEELEKESKIRDVKYSVYSRMFTSNTNIREWKWIKKLKITLSNRSVITAKGQSWWRVDHAMCIGLAREFNHGLLFDDVQAPTAFTLQDQGLLFRQE